MPNLIECEPERAIKTLGKVVLALNVAGNIALPVPAEAHPNLVNSVTLVHGNGSRDKLSMLVMDWNGTTPATLKEVIEKDIFLIPPFNEFRDIINIYYKHPVENLNCDQDGKCDGFAVVREVDRVTNLGIPIHFNLVVIKSDFEWRGAGQGIVALRSALPNNHGYAATVRPETPRPEARELFAATIAHELAHEVAGFDHTGGDIMEGKTFSFNPQHTKELRDIFALGPYRFLIPKNEIRPVNAITLTSKLYQTKEMSIDAVAFTPDGTTQLYSEVIPYNRDGAGVFDYAATPLAVHAWSEIGRKIPAPPQWYGLLPDMTYTWKVRSSNSPVPLTKADGTVNKDDPRWIQVEGWPNTFFPNPGDEKQFKTPKRDSSKIFLKTLLVGQETNNLTPTLTWDNDDKDVFYYEVQVSKDPNFSIEPGSPPLYWELRHGGQTKPPNSYTIPDAFPLEPATTYYWRVRPRIQGDGTPVAWTNPKIFETTADARKLSESELQVIRNVEGVDWKAMNEDRLDQMVVDRVSSIESNHIDKIIPDAEYNSGKKDFLPSKEDMMRFGYIQKAAVLSRLVD